MRKVTDVAKSSNKSTVRVMRNENFIKNKAFRSTLEWALYKQPYKPAFTMNSLSNTLAQLEIKKQL